MCDDEFDGFDGFDGLEVAGEDAGDGSGDTTGLDIVAYWCAASEVGIYACIACTYWAFWSN